MSIIDVIKKRESVRTYTGEKLRPEHVLAIEDFISKHKAPFGVNTRINLISTEADEKAIKLGTYGFISGASHYLTLVCDDAPFAEEGGAYLFEQLVLFCTELGLGTCWLGGSFSRKNFKKQLNLKSNETLRIVSPVGYESEKKRFFDSLLKPESRKINPRKAFGSLFFNKNISTSLSEEAAGVYAQPLEMLRLAPSANNAQPWRIIMDDGVFHFYRVPAMFSAIDIGIALCHFEVTCKELGINGKFETLNPSEIKSLLYVISWISE